jgi:hypothetical protein
MSIYLGLEMIRGSSDWNFGWIFLIHIFPGFRVKINRQLTNISMLSTAILFWHNHTYSEHWHSCKAIPPCADQNNQYKYIIMHHWSMYRKLWPTVMKQCNYTSSFMTFCLIACFHLHENGLRHHVIFCVVTGVAFITLPEHLSVGVIEEWHRGHSIGHWTLLVYI